MKTETFVELTKLCGIETALNCIRLETLNTTLKVKNKDFTEFGSYSDRLVRKFNKKICYGHTFEQCQRFLEILESCRAFEMRVSMQGLGGCEFRTLEQILKVNGLCTH